jgi:ribosomal protein S18 acetylase RimI-like enzyme
MHHADQILPQARLRPVCAADLDAVLRVQAACYPPAMQEARDVVRARIEAAGSTSIVAVHQDGAASDCVIGYVFAYRSRLGVVTPLGAGFEVDPVGDTLYLHDLAVAPAAAGGGLARRLAARLLAQARESQSAWCALVSVQDSRGFWERLGYRAAGCDGDDARAALATYPVPALYMVRRTRG